MHTRGDRIAEIRVTSRRFVFHVGPRVAKRIYAGHREGNDWWARWPVFREHRDDDGKEAVTSLHKKNNKKKTFVCRVPVNLLDVY